MKKVLITGANGTLGHYLTRVIEKGYQNIPLGKRELDITDKDKVHQQVKFHKPHIVVHLAALTNVDACEKYPKKAYDINARGTKNIVDVCRENDILLVFMSTSAVFDGKKRGYFEHDEPQPINIYGKTKLEAEKYIQEKLKRYFIVRTGWIVGGGRKEKKFISYIINDLMADKKISVVSDKFGTLAYAWELANFIKSLFSQKKDYGIYHYGSKGICSRLDIAQEIAKVLKKKSNIMATTSDAFKDVFFAPRPKYEVLKSTKVGFDTTWKKSLKKYIQNEFI